MSPPPLRWGLPPYAGLPPGTHRESDLLGTVGIFEGVISILIGEAGRADGSDHHSAAVAPNGVLEQARQLAVSVGHMRLAALGK